MIKARDFQHIPQSDRGAIVSAVARNIRDALGCGLLRQTQGPSNLLHQLPRAFAQIRGREAVATVLVSAIGNVREFKSERELAAG
jgi:hypothetical protein